MKDHTFIFSDLVGFTALTEANGDEHAAELALDFYERVRTMLRDHGAEEVKTIGDAVMLRCEDPEPAVRLGPADGLRTRGGARLSSGACRHAHRPGRLP